MPVKKPKVHHSSGNSPYKIYIFKITMVQSWIGLWPQSVDPRSLWTGHKMSDVDLPANFSRKTRFAFASCCIKHWTERFNNSPRNGFTLKPLQQNTSIDSLWQKLRQWRHLLRLIRKLAAKGIFLLFFTNWIFKFSFPCYISKSYFRNKLQNCTIHYIV